MTRRIALTLTALALLVVGTTAVASAQTITLDDDSTFDTTLTANVSEQANVSVPTGVTFNVTDISTSTAAGAATVTVDNIVLATDTKQLQVSIQADAASFTPSVTGATTWSAGDVTWNAATWTSATGASGMLSESAFGEVATCSADTASCSTTGLVFTLGANTAVKRSGNHTLSISWKFASIGA